MRGTSGADWEQERVRNLEDKTEQTFCVPFACRTLDGSNVRPQITQSRIHEWTIYNSCVIVAPCGLSLTLLTL